MNAKIRCLLIGAAVALLPACASMDEREAYIAPERAPSLLDQDAAYIATVERIARRRGIHVTWVNAPTRRPVASVTAPQ